MEAQRIKDMQQKPKEKPISLFLKANIGVAFLVCAMALNITRWSDDAWYAILLMVIGFELFTLVLMLIIKLKPYKKH